MTDNNIETVTIPKNVFDGLIESEAELICLEVAGVDNWNWYSESLENLNETHTNLKALYYERVITDGS